MASKNALIENITKRKISYKKRQKTFLKRAYVLSTIGDVEMAIIVNSPYHDEPKVFPNHDDAINTFTKFRDLSASEKSINMETQEKLTKKMIKKMEKQLPNIRKKNRVSEFTNKMYEALNEKDIPTDMHPYDLNDLSYVINQNLKQVHEAIKMKIGGENYTSNAPQSIAGMMASPMSLPMMASSMFAPVFPPMTSQMDPLINIPQMDALMSINNYENYYVGIPQSPVFSEMLDWTDYDIRTLFDDPFFNNINVQDPNNKNNM